MENKNNDLLNEWANTVARLEKGKGLDNTVPALSYVSFMGHAREVFINKSSDYEDRYLKALISLDARTIWTWEIEKKLDRLRTWIKRGELQVKDEGIRNSVDDLFVYTVQFYAYMFKVEKDGIPGETFLKNVQNDRAHFFWYWAGRFDPFEWVEYLEFYGLIKPEEKLLKLVIRSYMGDKITKTEWQEAIRTILA